MYWDIETLADRLPEDIEKMKWAGDFENARKRIDYLLESDVPERIKTRLRIEKIRLLDMEKQYPHDRATALAMMQEKIPDFTMEELDQLDLQGGTDYLYVKGEKKYFRGFRNTLLKVNPDLMDRAGVKRLDPDSLINRTIHEIAEKGEKKIRLKVKASLQVRENAFVSGETYTVHLPIPAPCEQIKDIRLLGFSHTPYKIAPENAHQRTVCFKETLTERDIFWVEYEFTSHIKYWKYGDMDRVYDFDDPPTEADLAEQLPHLTFSPYLRGLEKELAGHITDPLQAAKVFYDYITCNVNYSFVRHYLNIDNGAEYVALNLKGDCGLQALLFIALCRLHGIPARWQSGLTTEPGDVGCHDWAQFYIEGPGWLFCDPSYGGGGRRRNDEWRREFFFGNLDPYRMIANRAYCKPFDPPKQFLRADPFDNQDGEAESSIRMLSSFETETHQYAEEL